MIVFVKPEKSLMTYKKKRKTKEDRDPKERNQVNEKIPNS